MNPSTTKTLARQGQPTGIEPVSTVPPMIQDLLKSMRGKLAKVVSNAITPERLLHLASQAFTRTPRLAECTRESIIEAMIIAGQTGLEPFGPRHFASLIPRNNDRSGKLECQFQLEYRGWLELINRGGAVESQAANVVYREEIESGAFKATHWPPELHHEVTLDHEIWPDDELVLSYYACNFRGGGHFQLICDRARIEKSRAMSKSKGGPWIQHFAPMARKTAILAAASSGMIPMSAELAVALEHEAEGGDRTVAGGMDYTPTVKPVDVGVIPPEPEPDPPADVPRPAPEPAQEPRSRSKGPDHTPSAPAPRVEPPAKPDVPDPVDRATQDARQSVQALRDELRITSREWNDALAQCDLVGIPVMSWSIPICEALMNAIEAQASARPPKGAR